MSLPIFELRVFQMKNSIVILYTAILGGDVAACRPSCARAFYEYAKRPLALSLIYIDFKTLLGDVCFNVAVFCA